MMILFPLGISLLAVPLAIATGYRKPEWVAPVSTFMAGGAFVMAWLALFQGGAEVIFPWAPSWGLHFYFRYDGLASLYIFLATGIGFLIMLYSWAYIPRHLEHEGRPVRDITHFYAWLNLFMFALVGLVMAFDLILLFLFWDLTAITSYFLIGYDSQKDESRQAALMALLVTGITSVLYIIGAMVLALEAGSFSFNLLAVSFEPTGVQAAGIALIVIAGLAKAAQVPFHFWLPRAMAAPTPVSAYLHSAAMVAAGVFLLGRFYPFIQQIPWLLNGLMIIGLLSIFTGSILALTQDKIKSVLAYSTVAQYGYIVTMFGIGGEIGVTGAVFYIAAHAVIKSGLFLVAGIVIESTGNDRLSQVGGLLSSTPTLAVFSGILSASLAGLPLTIGYFKDELFFEAALHRGMIFLLLAIAGATLTLVYTWRFWSGIFLGKGTPPITRIPIRMSAPIFILGFLSVLFGLFSQTLSRISEAASASLIEGIPAINPGYHFELQPGTVSALSVYIIGIILIFVLRIIHPWLRSAAEWGKRFGPEVLYWKGLSIINRLGQLFYGLETRNFADRFTSILIPAFILLGIGLIFTPTTDAYRVLPVRRSDFFVIMGLVLTALTGLSVILPRGHLTQILAFSTVGLGLTIVFAALGAPDVALVTVLVGAITTIFFFVTLSLFPNEMLRQQAEKNIPRRLQLKQWMVGLLASLFAFIITWGVLSQPAATDDTVAAEYLRIAPSAHAGDVVTAILSDFRGLDTLGEITVVMITLLGVATLIRRGKLS